MKKIPTLFVREFENGKIARITDKITPGCELVLEGKTTPTIKYDGSCCAVFNGIFYKRYDAKKGKKYPIGAIPCQPAPDPVTGHWPFWVPLSEDPSDKWFWAAFKDACDRPDFEDNKTYEAYGKHFQGNPYGIDHDTLYKHGSKIIDLKKEDLTFEGIKAFLKITPIEGIVFWTDAEPLCKIKRSDFGFAW